MYAQIRLMLRMFSGNAIKDHVQRWVLCSKSAIWVQEYKHGHEMLGVGLSPCAYS